MRPREHRLAGKLLVVVSTNGLGQSRLPDQSIADARQVMVADCMLGQRSDGFMLAVINDGQALQSALIAIRLPVATCTFVRLRR